MTKHPNRLKRVIAGSLLVTAGTLLAATQPALAAPPQPLSVPATANIYAAGRQEVNIGTRPIVVPTGSAAKVQFGVRGRWQYAIGVPTPADGLPLTSAHGCGGQPPCIVEPEYHIAGLVDGTRFWYLAGVFLGPANPTTTPAMLDFTNNHNFASLSPGLGQPFFIGDGTTSSGQAQTFVVPAGATRLILGMADICRPKTMEGCYGDNSGSLSVTPTFS
jgi:hypothetical protein